MSLFTLDLNLIAFGVGMAGLLFILICYNLIKKSVGFPMAKMIFQLKTKKKNKSKILLQINLPNQEPKFKAVSVATIIKYDYKINSEDKEGIVMYDYTATNKLFGVTLLECSPDDFVPRNRALGTSLPISGDIVRKNIIDSSKTDFKTDSMKKFMKIALPLAIVITIGVILYTGSQSESLAECSAQLVTMAKNTQVTEIIAK